MVRSGDTIESICTALALSPAELRRLNNLARRAQPQVGSVLVLPQGDEAHDQQLGLLLAARGTVTVQVPGGAPTPRLGGQPLPTGSTVCTAADSFATVRLARSLEALDHDDVNLLSETCLTVVSASARAGHRSSHIEISQGSISIRAMDERQGTVIVETASGVTTGEQGGFRVTVEEQATRTEALLAPVAVMGAGAQVDLAAGQGSRVIQGQAPSPPVDLLLPGTPVLPDAGAILLRPDFRWTPVEHAMGYRVEIASAQDFSDIVLVEEVAAAAWNPELLFLPYRVPGLWWRISSFDRVGFLGAPSEPRGLEFPPGMGP